MDINPIVIRGGRFPWTTTSTWYYYSFFFFFLINILMFSICLDRGRNSVTVWRNRSYFVSNLNGEILEQLSFSCFERKYPTTLCLICLWCLNKSSCYRQSFFYSKGTLGRKVWAQPRNKNILCEREEQTNQVFIFVCWPRMAGTAEIHPAVALDLPTWGHVAAQESGQSTMIRIKSMYISNIF